MSGTLANGAQKSVPLGTGVVPTKMARIEVEAVGATKYALGTAAVTNLTPATPPEVISVVAGANLFAVGTPARKLSVFDGGSGMTTITIINQTGESMDYTVAVRWRT